MYHAVRKKKNYTRPQKQPIGLQRGKAMALDCE